MSYRFSLQRIVIAGLLAGMLIPAGVSLQLRFARERTRFERELQTSLDRSAEVLAQGVAESLWDLDKGAVEAVVAALARIPQVSRVVVRDDAGKDFARRKTEPASEEIQVSRSVLHGADVIGSVEVAFSTAGMENKLREQLLENTLATLAEMLASLALVYVIMRVYVLNPVDRLRRQANQLSHGELSTPFDWQGRDEVGELGLTLEFARAELQNTFSLVEKKNAELEALNQDLEALVVQRTESIRAILDHVRAGFVLVDEEGRLLEGFTKSCESLFGRMPYAGDFLADLLKVRSSLFANFQLFVRQVFEDVFPEEVSLAQIQKRHNVGDRVLSIEGNAVRDEASGRVRAILFTIMDVTRLEKMEAENRQNRTVIQILHEPEAFVDFVTDAKKEVERALLAMAAQDDTKARAALHTLKGNAAAFGLQELVSYIHNVEDKAKISCDDLEGIEWMLSCFLEENRSLLNLSLDANGQEEIYKVGRSALGSLTTIVESGLDRLKMVSEVSDWIQTVQRKSARVFMGPIVRYAESLAHRLGKEVDVSVSGEDVLIDPLQVKPVLQSLVHLVRNSLDHGFEEPGDRGVKPERGRIHMAISEEENLWRILFSDDGRGVDVDGVTSSALRRGLVTEQEMSEMSSNEKLLLIFRDGLSTSLDVSELSGRGMGMCAVHAVVEAAGGRIAIENAVGQGVCFEIEIPKLGAASLRPSRVA